MISYKYNSMPKKSKINIFNKMKENELDELLKSNNIPTRLFKRLVAMKLISEGFNHKETANILLVSYESIYRWAKKCEKEGIEGLIPNFNGGRPSQLSPEMKESLKMRIINDERNLSMTDAKHIIKEEYGVDYSLPYVCRLIRSLGFNYGKPRPKYGEAPENNKIILKKTSKKLK